MSVTYAIWTVVVALLTCPLTVSAAEPDIGSSFNGGDFSLSKIIINLLKIACSAANNAISANAQKDALRSAFGAGYGRR